MKPSRSRPALGAELRVAHAGERRLPPGLPDAQHLWPPHLLAKVMSARPDGRRSSELSIPVLFRDAGRRPAKADAAYPPPIIRRVGAWVSVSRGAGESPVKPPGRLRLTQLCGILAKEAVAATAGQNSKTFSEYARSHC